MEKYEFVLAYADKLAFINCEQICCESWLADELSKLSDYAFSGKEDEPEKPCILHPKDVTKVVYTPTDTHYLWVVELQHNPTGAKVTVGCTMEKSQSKATREAWALLEKKVLSLNQSEKSETE